MKRLVLLLLFMFATVVNAGAYEDDAVFILKSADITDDSYFLVDLAHTKILNKLMKSFPCLRIVSQGDINNLVAYARQLELKGDNSGLDAKIINGVKNVMGAKYLIALVASHDSRTGYRLLISAISMKQKGDTEFFRDGGLFSTLDKAEDELEPLVDKLAKAFVKRTSDSKWDNEVCPFKGRVDVTFTSKRKQHKEDTYYSYCNGDDQQGKKSETITADGKELWKLQRFGNPNTYGTMDYSSTETYMKEEVDGCHVCSSGRKGPWRFKDEVKSSIGVSGLFDSTSSTEAGQYKNKDTTIRLHFSGDGTYEIIVRAVSAEGKKNTTHTTTAEGTCDLLNKRDAQKATFTKSLDKKFGPFNGTVFDKKLTGKQTFNIPKEEIGEENELTIDFELERK
ncbi:hypothetical protein OR1_00339 [Geobacter sp. OR-1]|uniref:hypothetical protein n=1 Tax=Geobacter sp. OR-1 TaxID=1266765 RepID=UPI000541FF78|nr:hypothetical protein [Geobacter sp. OR-1]GAM08069.1 hypothetical protein OR1_00339 [Geobacter sp. OR-1]